MSYILRSQVGSYRFYYASSRYHVLFVGLSYLNFFKRRTLHHATERVLLDAWRFLDLQLERSRQREQFCGHVWRKLRPSQRSHVLRFSDKNFLKTVWSKLWQLLSIHLNLGACYSDTFVGLCTVALALVIMFFSVSVIQEWKWQINNWI